MYIGAVLVVTPYQYEQLYLTGIGIKYGISINDSSINLMLYGNYIILLVLAKDPGKKEEI
ncbi:hypothetical protein [Marinitoga sp. 38H-ov]|uniref:hypothetical protein n=1 Tax=Marinitoga sp. 38H-ov TaxID=1755814 RepID=UPI0013EB6D7C|nr:hypothetical protein [Marinitoga sp. 38H-ov]